jgi:hypothetical protein
MTEHEQHLAELVKLFGVAVPEQYHEGVATLASLFAQGELVTSFEGTHPAQRLACRGTP